MNKRGRKIAKTNGIFSSFFIVIKMFKYTKIIKKFVVCFYRTEYIVERGKNDKKPIKVVRQEAVIEYIKLNGRITNKEARELLELGDSTTKRILKEMVEENILVVKGERKSREYLLKY